MPLLERFLDPTSTSLKICGVTREADAIAIAELGVDAIGINFPAEGFEFHGMAPCIRKIGGQDWGTGRSISERMIMIFCQILLERLVVRPSISLTVWITTSSRTLCM